MKRVKITYGIGYGNHEDELEFDNTATDDEIKASVRDHFLERLKWSCSVVETGQ